MGGDYDSGSARSGGTPLQVRPVKAEAKDAVIVSNRNLQAVMANLPTGGLGLGALGGVIEKNRI